MRCAPAGYRAVLMAVDGAHALITYDNYRLAADDKMLNAALEDFAAVRGSIPNTNYIRHFAPLRYLMVSGRGRIEPVILSQSKTCLLYTSPSPRDGLLSRMPSSA